jgi:hypothetical protein
VDHAQSTLEHRYYGVYGKLEKRLSKGYQFLVSYTFAKNQDRDFRNDDVTRVGYYRSDWYPASAERQHRLVASGILQLPYGINFSAILDLRSSLPFNINSGTDLNGDTYGGDLVPGMTPNSGGRDYNLQAINDYRASIGRDPVTDDDIANPGFANLDFRVQKMFMVKAPHQLQFIFQVLNVTNKANFSTPNGNLRSSGFGVVNEILANINAPARQLEIAVRYIF